ncbi:MAG: Asp23/Gls24 family envelope stress response protein [Anaerolineales bacterium]|nr:Asp23/Gls24 family envelope stress response protein [Anaerolineales bacterium]
MDTVEAHTANQSLGRIEVAPEVITTIARFVIRDIEGVTRMGTPPSGLWRRATRHEGVVLQYEDGRLVFDIYVLMNPHSNMVETSRQLQAAIVEAMDYMVGIPVETVNIHVEDVTYKQDEVA